LIHRGHRDAFEAITRPHLGTLYRVALRLTGQREAAEDLVQDTCLKAYRSFEADAEVNNYKAWLLRIMTNAHIDNVRRKTERSVSELERRYGANGGDGLIAGGVPPEAEDADFQYSVHAAAASDPEARVHSRAFFRCVLRAIDRLAPEVRTVVVLAILEECRYDEIAEMLGCPVGTVRSRLSRGRQQLQVALADYVPPGMTSKSSVSQAASATASRGKDD
jgi:RNA polymerase sigma-70 factor (ECF subfamily)